MSWKFNPFTGQPDYDSVNDLSGYVPYTGATGAVDLGAQDFTTTGFGTFGGAYAAFQDWDNNILITMALPNTPEIDFFSGGNRAMVFGYDPTPNRGIFYSDASGQGVFFRADGLGLGAIGGDVLAGQVLQVPIGNTGVFIDSSFGGSYDGVSALHITDGTNTVCVCNPSGYALSVIGDVIQPSGNMVLGTNGETSSATLEVHNAGTTYTIDAVDGYSHFYMLSVGYATTPSTLLGVMDGGGTFANLGDGSGAAGWFNYANNTNQVYLASSAGAGYFYNATNSIYLIDGTYAINATGCTQLVGTYAPSTPTLYVEAPGAPSPGDFAVGMIFSFAGQQEGDAIQIQNRIAMAASKQPFGFYQYDTGEAIMYQGDGTAYETGFFIDGSVYKVYATTLSPSQDIFFGVNCVPSGTYHLEVDGISLFVSSGTAVTIADGTNAIAATGKIVDTPSNATYSKYWGEFNGGFPIGTPNPGDTFYDSSTGTLYMYTITGGWVQIS